MLGTPVGGRLGAIKWRSMQHAACSMQHALKYLWRVATPPYIHSILNSSDGSYARTKQNGARREAMQMKLSNARHDRLSFSQTSTARR